MNIELMKMKNSRHNLRSYDIYAFFTFTEIINIFLALLFFAAALEEEQKNNANSNGTDKSELNGKQKHQMKHRELFLSRQVETLPATHIRGKCSVTLLNEEESLLSYLNKDVSSCTVDRTPSSIFINSNFFLHFQLLQDTFFYCLVFDPTQKTLLADKGEIRVGSRYQTELQALLKEGESDNRTIEELETLVWTPHHNLNDRKIDQFLVVSRSVGTFARALDCSSSVKQPSLHMSAAAASRDITLVSDVALS
jgi:metastasis-associated protein MTA